MKVVSHRRLGPPAEVLEVLEVPSVPLNPGEIRVRMLATPIHPSSLLQIAGLYGKDPELPAIPGAEGCGEVIEVAPDVSSHQLGQRVLLTSGAGTWREELTGPAAAFIGVPSTDPEQMAMLVVNPMTAHLLVEEAQVPAGGWLIQNAANSAVGQLVIQLGARRGIKTVNVVRRESLVPELKALGADVVLVDGPDFSQRLRDATGGAPMAHAIDAVGGKSFDRLVRSLADGATLTSYGLMSGERPPLDVMSVIFRDVRVRGFWLSRWFQTADRAAREAAFGALIPLVASGELSVKVESRFTLDQIGLAVERAASGGRDGKVLLVAD